MKIAYQMVEKRGAIMKTLHKWDNIDHDTKEQLLYALQNQHITVGIYNSVKILDGTVFRILILQGTIEEMPQ